jgi:hypothetical protein
MYNVYGFSMMSSSFGLFIQPLLELATQLVKPTFSRPSQLMPQLEPSAKHTWLVSKDICDQLFSANHLL